MSQNLISTSGISASFVILTTIFFSFKAYKSNDVNQDPFSLAWTIMYIIIIMLIEFFNNLSIASQICDGSSQNTFSVFIYTLVPNFLILGSIITIISALPGWLSPFSNTIGYFIVSCMGLSRNFNSLLKSANGTGARALITKIISDAGLLSISVSSHALSKLQCEYSPEEMKKTVAQLHEEEQEMESEKANNKPVLYSKNN